MRERFTQEEVNEILLRAVERQPVGREVSREELEGLAAEIGVSPEALWAAERDWATAFDREAEERRIFEALRREHGLAKRRLFSSVLGFVFTTLLFRMIARTEDDFIAIALLFLLPWLMVIVWQAAHVWSGRPPGRERAFRKWREERRAIPTDDDIWWVSPRRRRL